MRSQVSTIATILFAELIPEVFDVDPKFVHDHFTRPRVVIFSVMSFPRIRPPVGQPFVDPELFRDKTPILVESLEFADEIGDHIPVRIDKPIKLVTLRQ